MTKAKNIEETMQNTKIRLPLLPLRDILVFPSTVVPLFVGRDKSIQALEQAMATSKEIFLAAQMKAKTNDPSAEDIYRFGTIANILQLLRLPDGTVKVLVEGQKRAKITEFLRVEDYFYVEAEELEEDRLPTVETEAVVRTVKTAFDNFVRLNKRIPPELLMSISAIDDESKLSDTLVSHLSNLKLSDKQRLLEEINPVRRLEIIYGFIQGEIEIMRVEKKIKARVKRQMEKTQKEYYLNEQMQAIQKELGDKDDNRAEIQELESQIKKKPLSTEAREKLNKEIKKLKLMSQMSAEATVVRNYIDTVLSLPWGTYTEEKRDINFAEEVLNKDHFGLEKIKERILEYLAVRSLVSTVKGPILCFVGPPGVGKTSLARSIAQATGREFARFALGGVRDEAEIRGHRRTYIGSMPGKLILAMRKAQSSNPVILLDEIDKLGQDFRGDPSSALLEVLDPEQNHSFNDHYLDLDYDLSKVLFIATANQLHGIPRPLLDRMEVINLAGYTEEEKMAISRQFLVPKQLETNGLKDHDVKIEESAVRELVQHYTRESGVRNLEREISNLCRKVARKHLVLSDKPTESAAVVEPNGKDTATSVKENNPKIIQKEFVPPKFETIHVTVDDKTVQEFLGPRKFRIGQQNTVHEIGICTGMAWTEVGGDLLVTEIAILPGKGKLTITGKLGEVMQESAQAALSYVRSRGSFLELEEGFYEKLDIHIHVPEGAIPKDGPSAGITMATALTSALTKRPINKDVAMTGEITLRGRVLPIGGLKEKILAAHRGGIKKIIIPKENHKDLHDIPKNILDVITVVAVEHMDEVLMEALLWKRDPDGQTMNDTLFEKLFKITQDIHKSQVVTH